MIIFKIIFGIIEIIFNLIVAFFYGIKTFLALFLSAVEAEKDATDKNPIDYRSLHDDLFNEEYGTHRKDMKIYKQARKKAGLSETPNSNIDDDKSPEDRERENEAIRKKDPLKAKGDEYEKYIGRQFEKNGDLVIYNGYVYGRSDQGIDLVVISERKKTINLVQCKNWDYMPLSVEEVQKISHKLSFYHPSHYFMKVEDINFYLSKKRSTKNILKLLHSSKKYKTRKTLYLSSDKVVDLKLGEHLTMMSPNIFKYKDTKIVIKPIS